MEYDVFICHASEDKKDFVKPLADALVKENLKVWYDKFELTLGDSLREKIDYGLANSRYGLVVLSRAFFGKKWAKEELDGLAARQTSEKEKVILPVWHGVGYDDVKKFSPMLAGKLAARSEEGLEAVVAQIVSVCKEEPLSERRSVFQAGGPFGLREQYLEIIRKNNRIEWNKLISETLEPIPNQLKDWKKEGETAASKGGKDWEQAVLKVANICLPAFIPIFASIEAGRPDLWKESIRVLRRLALLEDEMGGGTVCVLRIGNHMLYVAGSLGMALSVYTRQLNFVDEWISLPMPILRGQKESLWLNIRYAHSPPVGFELKEPFKFLLSIYQSDYMKGFFTSQERLTDSLFLSNLLASLVELRHFAQTENGQIAFVEHQKIRIDHVCPLWVAMGTQRFKILTVDLFGSSQDVVKFVFPSGFTTADKFWCMWKQWWNACIEYWESRGYYNLGLCEYMMLPGEPTKY